MLFDDTNKQILIVGGSGGIGFALTQLMIKNGHNVFVTTRHIEQAVHLRALAEQHPQRLSLLEMDIVQQDDVASVFEQIKSKTGKLHLVLNATGLLHDDIVQPEKRLEDLKAEHLQRSFAVNSIGPMILARYALPLLKHDEISLLANMSARVGSISDNYIGGWYGYRASKAAQNMVTRTLAIEMRRRSKQTIVVGLHPGTVDTSLSQPFQRGLKPGQLKTPLQAATDLYQVMNGLCPEKSGKVFAWDGSEIPA